MMSLSHGSTDYRQMMALETSRNSIGSPDGWRRRTLCGLSLVLAFAVSLPEELPAAPTVTATSTLAVSQLDLRANEMLLVHCCHAHPLPPYSAYCCHAGGGVYVVPGYGYGYGVPGVRGQSRRVARRTSRRVSRRR
jgi:hypothetical protein